MRSAISPRFATSIFWNLRISNWHQSFLSQAGVVSTWYHFFGRFPIAFLVNLHKTAWNPPRKTVISAIFSLFCTVFLFIGKINIASTLALHNCRLYFLLPVPFPVPPIKGNSVTPFRSLVPYTYGGLIYSAAAFVPEQRANVRRPQFMS